MPETTASLSGARDHAFHFLTLNLTGAGDHGSVSDSGAESCGEEARLRTAEVFMTGIQTAITANLEERGQQVYTIQHHKAPEFKGES